MLKIVMGFLLGSMLTLACTKIPHFILSASILLIAIFFLVYFVNHQRKYCSVIVALIIGYCLTASVASYQQLNGFKPAYEGKDLIVQGKINSLVKNNDFSRSFFLKVSSARLTDSTAPVNWRGTIRLSIYNEQPIVKTGERWQFQVRLKRSNGFMNPGGFDYEKWLFAKRIEASGYLRKSDQHKLLDGASWYSIDAARANIHQKIKSSMESISNKALVSALILAEKGDVSKQQWQVLRATGTSHLMAISGLHIGLVASGGLLFVWLLWWCFPALNLLISRRLAGTATGVLLAVSYALLAGMSIPTQRALTMVILGLFLLVGKQHLSAYRIITLALLAVLITDPLAVLNVGFYLSFAAVFVIIWLLRRVMKTDKFALLRLQGFLSLLMIPLSLLFFAEGSLISPVANLIAIPWVSFVIVPLSMLSILLSFISEDLALYLFEFLSFHLDALFVVLGLLAEVPVASVEAFHLPNLLLASLVVAGIILLLPSGLTWRYTACLTLFPLLFYQVDKPELPGSFWLTILDVGQGLAVVVETKNHSLVYDTGDRASESFDLGEMVVAPYLKRQSLDQIDALIISHDDRDHMGGLQAVLDSVKVKKVYGNRLALVESRHNELCKAGDSWEWDGVNFEFLHPEPEWQGKDNNRSCVMKISSKKHSVLLTGDIQRKAEKHLIRLHNTSLLNNPLLHADIVLMPHHGSNSSSLTQFIKAVNPKWAVASAGYRSRFKHPDQRVIKRYKKQGVKVLNTADSGAIQFKLKPDEAMSPPLRFRATRNRFWSRKY